MAPWSDWQNNWWASSGWTHGSWWTADDDSDDDSQGARDAPWDPWLDRASIQRARDRLNSLTIQDIRGWPISDGIASAGSGGSAVADQLAPWPSWSEARNDSGIPLDQLWPVEGDPMNRAIGAAMSAAIAPNMTAHMQVADTNIHAAMHAAVAKSGPPDPPFGNDPPIPLQPMPKRAPPGAPRPPCPPVPQPVPKALIAAAIWSVKQPPPVLPKSEPPKKQPPPCPPQIAPAAKPKPVPAARKLSAGTPANATSQELGRGMASIVEEPSGGSSSGPQSEDGMMPMVDSSGESVNSSGSVSMVAFAAGPSAVADGLGLRNPLTDPANVEIFQVGLYTNGIPSHTNHRFQSSLNADRMVFGLEQFSDPRKYAGAIQNHNAALKWCRQAVEPQNISYNISTEAHFMRWELPFDDFILVRPCVHGERHHFDFDYFRQRPWNWQQMISHFDYDDRKYVVQGPESSSRGIVGCWVAPRPGSYDHLMTSHNQARDRDGNVVRRAIWDFQVVRDDGTSVYLHPSWQTTKVSAWEAPPMPHQGSPRCGISDTFTVVPKGGPGTSNGPGTFQHYLKSQRSRVLRFKVP